MSERKLFGLFSGAQVALMVCTAIITPGAVYAVAFTSVVITDPVTGKEAFVDAGRRVYTYDPIAGYANNPANLVVINSVCPANNSTNVYTTPVGKAIIIKAMHMSYPDGTAGFDNLTSFYDNTTSVVMADFRDPNTHATFQADFGSGFYMHSGDILTCASTVSAYFTAYGYYVPAAAVPVK